MRTAALLLLLGTALRGAEAAVARSPPQPPLPPSPPRPPPPSPPPPPRPPAIITNFAQLKAAVLNGGSYTLGANIQWPGQSNLVVGVNLTLTGNSTLCGGQCQLDAQGLDGHFVVHNQAWSATGIYKEYFTLLAHGSGSPSKTADNFTNPGSHFAPMSVVALTLINVAIVNGARGQSAPCLGGTQNQIGRAGSGAVQAVVPELFQCIGMRSSSSQDNRIQYNDPSETTKCLFLHCAAIVVAQHATVIIDRSTFSNNNGYTDAGYAAMGGALSAEITAPLVITRTSFINNSVTNSNGASVNFGGAIAGAAPFDMASTQYPGTTLISNCTFSGNLVSGQGGAIWWTPVFGALTVTDSTFSSNVAWDNGLTNSGMGGALFFDQFNGQYNSQRHISKSATNLANSVADVYSENFYDSTTVGGKVYAASDAGRMTYSLHATYVVQRCSFTNNQAIRKPRNAGSSGSQGGALTIKDGIMTVSVVNCTFTANTANEGGAVFYAGSGFLVAYTLIGKISNQAGPLLSGQMLTDFLSAYQTGISLKDGTPLTSFYDYKWGQEINSTLFPVGDYVSLAPIADLTGLSLSITGSSFVNNVAFTGGKLAAGGAVHSRCGSTIIQGSTFTSNSAEDTSPTAALATGGAVYVTNACGGPDFLSFIVTKLSVASSTFTSNSAYGRGGAIIVSNALGYSGNVAATLASSTFTNNGAADYAVSPLFQGGALFLDRDAQTAITACSFTANNAYQGGGIYVNGAANTTIGAASIMTLNTAKNGGGALYVANGAALTDAGSNITSNTASLGGAVYLDSSTVSLTSTLLSSNVASIFGGAVYVSNGPSTLSFQTASITGNNASTSGGAVYSLSSLPTSDISSTFASNSAPSGGAFYVAGPLILAGSVLSANAATTMGGAVYALGGANLSVTSTTFVANSAESGGAVTALAGATSAFIGANFTGNSATAQGGALQLSSSAAFSAGCLFAGNSAPNGGALAVDSASVVNLSSTTATGNQATYGGALHVASPTVTVNIANLNTSGNTASYAGGLSFFGPLAANQAPLQRPCLNCLNVAGNLAAVYGSGLASAPTSFTASVTSLEVRTGSKLPAWTVNLFDAYGNAVMEWPGLTVSVTATGTVNPRGELRGTTSVVYGAGAAVFDNLLIYDDPDAVYQLTYTLFAAGLDALPSSSGTVTAVVAHCITPFEYYNSDMLLCSCIPGAYFNAGAGALGTGACVACPLGAHSPADAKECEPCAANTFAFNNSNLADPRGSYTYNPPHEQRNHGKFMDSLEFGIVCMNCPPLSEAPPGSYHISQCGCSTGKYAMPSPITTPGFFPLQIGRAHV
jgi:hypothetical protein